MSKVTYPPGHILAADEICDLQGQPELRDRFAMAALTGELASQSLSGEPIWWPADKAPALARRCYAIADAMMEARK